jgi:transcriptional regulator with XRE-family HTH domain
MSTAPKPTDGTLMRRALIPTGNKSAVSSFQKTAGVQPDRALGSTKSMKQSERTDYESIDKPWRDEGILRELIVERDLSVREAASLLGCSYSTVDKWKGKLGIERSRPYQEEEVLRQLYIEERMTQKEIGERFGVRRDAIRHWMKEHGIERRGKEWGAMKPYATYYIDGDGYPVWESGSEKFDNRAKVLVHRLAAVAWFGLDAVKDNHVHHKNGHRLDIRESNLEPLTISDHSSHHAHERWGRGVPGWTDNR